MLVFEALGFLLGRFLFSRSLSTCLFFVYCTI